MGAYNNSNKFAVQHFNFIRDFPLQGETPCREGKIEQEYIPRHTHMEMDHVHIRQIKIEHLLERLSE